MTKRHLAGVGVVLALSLTAAFAFGASQRVRPTTQRRAEPPKTGETKMSDWSSVDRLVSEQKLEEASAAIEKLLAAAKQRGDEAEWTKALIRWVGLRSALHGPETAVRFLMDQPWPQRPLYRAVLELYYAQSLVSYAQVYSWEVNQRERVASGGPVDLKAWTRDQIYAAAAQAYARVWKQRETLGQEPVSDMGQWLTPNTYPKEIRPTLRDAVSYLFVEMLADTAGWRPEQSADIYRLDLKALVTGQSPRSGMVVVDDPSLHPLTRIGAILDDLELWHERAKQREAALEVRLERARVLFHAFSQSADKRLVIDHLEKRLQRDRELGWWSMGMAQFASLVNELGGRGSLVRARQIALEGAVAHPGSPGAQLCQAIVRQIELPSYDINTMRIDGPRKRSIQVTHRNVRTLFFRAFPVDLENQIRTARDYNLLPNDRQITALLRSAKPVAEWQVNLPETPDYKSHHTFVTPPLENPGLYAVVASADPLFQEPNNRIVGVNFMVSDLVAITRADRVDGLEIQILSGRTGEAVAGAEVDLYRFDWRKGHKKADTKKTDAEGRVRFTGSSNEAHFAVARHGSDLSLATRNVGLLRHERAQRDQGALVYTDRAVYRPLQTVYFKVIAYAGTPEEARLHVAAQTRVRVILRDANGEEVATQTLRTNAYGSVAGQFAIPAGRLLGNWSLSTDRGGGSGIKVEEYKRPTFEVSLKEPKEALRLNRPATLRGEARYYFGLPVTSGQVRWRVTREPVYPIWWGWWWSQPPSPGSQMVATGTSPLRDDGSFELTFKPEADERSEGRSEVTFRYRAFADVTDEGGETRSADRSFRLGLVAVEARIDAEAQFGREGAPAQMTVVRTDLDGNPRLGQGTWRLVALQQPKETLLPADQPLQKGARPTGQDGEENAEGNDTAPEFESAGDKLRPRWDTSFRAEAALHAWPEGAEIARGALVHNEKGEARLSLPALQLGVYRISYETKDDFGATYRMQKEWVVAGTRARLQVPAYFAAEAPVVRVGDKVRLLAHSGLPGQTLFLERVRAGRRISRQVLRAGRDSALIEIPITEEDRGGCAWELVVERDHQVMRLDVRVAVPWDDRELKVELSSFRDRLRPGAKETWRVTVKGPPGAKPEAAAAELLAYMYDRSLDVFAPHRAPSPMSLWPDRSWLRIAGSNLGMENAVLRLDHYLPVPFGPAFTPDQLHFEDGYAIGGVGRRSYGGMAHFRRTKDGAPPPPMPASRAAAAPPAEPKALVQRMEAPTGALADNKKEADAEQASSTGAAPAEAVPIRANFAETAFWTPQLLTGPDGSAAIEFTVPDSVTSWAVFVHAVTKDLWSGSTRKQAESVKELMVRPYLPRFLREGDTAELKVVVNNATDRPLSGEVRLEIADADSHESLAAAFGLAQTDLIRSFTAGKQGSTNVSFRLAAPRRVLTAAFKVVAKAGEVSDGELRPVPVLPGRLHLAQSRFVTLRDKDRRTMTFADLSKADSTRINEQLVVTVDAQLLYSVLAALPYLINYPYECTEQTLNRFLSSAIVSSVFRDQPAIARMAKELSKRDTPLEQFDAADPNRKMALEESPWLFESKGAPLDPKSGLTLAKVLDPKVAAAERDQALAKLRKAQTAIGGFPWFPGGPPSPYMTLYLLHGFAKAVEFQVPVPKDMITRAWAYLAQHVRAEDLRRMREKDCCWELLTFMNYVAGAFPDSSWTEGGLSDAERREILDFSFKHWKKHSPYLKAYLALTLKRMGRPGDARLVWASVMDSAKTAPDQGTFWAQEDRSWLWYNDTIESHAFALRTLTELDPGNPKKDGLVLWLLLNKKLSQWKSTRATAEVIYSLVHYMKQEGQLGIREAVDVTIGGEKNRLVFEPEVYTGKGNRVVVPGERVSAERATVVVEKETKGLAFASATWHFSTEKLPAESRSDFFSVTREYFLRDAKGKEATLRPLKEGAILKVGDEVEVHLSLRTKHPAEYVHLRDPRGAGFEPTSQVSRYKYDLGIVWYEEIRDSGTNFFFEWLPQGEYTFKYRIRASMAGAFRAGPATVQSLYAPEFNAYSSGAMLEVKEK